MDRQGLMDDQASAASSQELWESKASTLVGHTCLLPGAVVSEAELSGCVCNGRTQSPFSVLPRCSHPAPTPRGLKQFPRPGQRGR
jgi:hypothetical protein